MAIYLLFGVVLGIVVCILYINYIDPIIKMKQDVYQYKQTDIATEYSMHTQKIVMDFYREYPEADVDNAIPENTQAIGYQMDIEDYYDDESECEDKKIGFHISNIK